MKAAYRPEIDGLRTIAVLGVVLFHLQIAGFSGGFVGVDIFFVISGFLITRNILRDIKNESFSFFLFYERRARRILPALIFTVVLTFVAGFLWLGPLPLRSLAKESTHALLSISNIQYWRESKEYFAPASNQLVLLHCWSLSLEEQFYLIWPVFLVFISRANKVRSSILLGAILSLIAAIYFSANDRQGVFFLTPFRIFEFAIGSAVLFIQPYLSKESIVAESLTLVGVGATLASFLFLDEHSNIVLVTLVPSAGAAAIILGGSRSISSRLLTLAPALILGRASYSLYLCHWPIIFFARIVAGEAAETTTGAAVSMTLMIATALLMQRYVEQRFRGSGNAAIAKSTFYKFGTVIAVLVIITHSTYLARGLEWRLPEQRRVENAALRPGSEACQRIPGDRCAFGELSGPLGLEVIGDSFATHYMAGLNLLLKSMHLQGAMPQKEGCPLLVDMPLPMDTQNPERCRKQARDQLAIVQNSLSHIIISHHWLNYQNARLPSDLDRRADEALNYSIVQRHLEKTIEALAKPGRKFLIVGAQVTANQCTFDSARLLPGPLPHADLPPCPAKPRTEAVAEGAPINTMLRSVREKYTDQVELLIPVDTYCDAECPTVHDGKWLYLDAGHFNVAGSKYAIGRARDQLNKFLDYKS